MNHRLSKLTISIAASAVLAGDAIALDPAITNFGYVNSYNNSTLTIFNASDPTKTKTITGVAGTSVGISPTGAWFYGTNIDNGTLTRYNAYSGATIESNITVGSNPYTVALSPDGTKAYVVNTYDNTISVINTTTNTVTATVNVGSAPFGAVLSPDGTKAYVVNMDDSTISVINTATNSVVQTITGVGRSNGISIAPDGSELYIPDVFANSLSVVDVSTGAVTMHALQTTSYPYANFQPFISPNLLTGTLSVSSAADMAAKGFSNYVNFAGGTLKATGSFTLSNPVYLHDASNLTYDDSSTFTTVAGGTVDTNGNDVTLSGEVSGVGGLTKDGAGVLTLSGANTYSGATAVSAGTLALSGGSAIADTGAISVASGATLRVDTAETIGSLAGAGNVVLNTDLTSGDATDTTFSGVISGNGALNKSGTGTLTLSGANTYSGGTTVSAGTLKGDTTSLQGNIVDNATVEFTQTTDGTYAGVLSGTGGVTKSGTGTLTLSGTNTYTGATAVNAGTINITGDSSSSAFTVASGATLSGSGTVGSAVINNGGILAPSSVSTLSIAGNLEMQSGSILKVNTFANGTNSKVSVTGTATLGGGSVEVTADSGGTWSNSTVYTILTATGGVSGTFASVSDNLAFLDPTLSYEADKVKLTLTRNDVSYADVVTPTQAPTQAPTEAPTQAPTQAPTEAPTQAPTQAPTEAPTQAPTQAPTLADSASSPLLYSVASLLDRAALSGNEGMAPLFTALNSMSAEGAREAFARLRGDDVGRYVAINGAMQAGFVNGTLSRMAAIRTARDTNGGIGLAGLRFADSGDSLSTLKALADAGVLTSEGFVDPSETNYNVWAKALGSRVLSSGDSAKNITSSKSDIGGVQIGVDKRYGETFVGISMANIKANSRYEGDKTTADSNSYQIGVYATSKLGSYRVDGTLGYSLYTNETSRLTPTGIAKGKANAHSVDIWAQTSYSYPLSKTFRIEPYMEASLGYYTQDGYDESGAPGANLKVSKYDANRYAIGVGTKLIKEFDDKKGYFDLSLGALKEMGDLEKPLTMRFAAAPNAGSFETSSLDNSGMVYKSSMGIGYKVGQKTELFVNIEGVKKDNETGVNGILGGKIRW